MNENVNLFAEIHREIKEKGFSNDYAVLNENINSCKIIENTSTRFVCIIKDNDEEYEFTIDIGKSLISLTKNGILANDELDKVPSLIKLLPVFVEINLFNDLIKGKAINYYGENVWTGRNLFLDSVWENTKNALNKKTYDYYKLFNVKPLIISFSNFVNDFDDTIQSLNVEKIDWYQKEVILKTFYRQYLSFNNTNEFKNGYNLKSEEEKEDDKLKYVNWIKKIFPTIVNSYCKDLIESSIINELYYKNISFEKISKIIESYWDNGYALVTNAFYDILDKEET